jgi:hypothetical protein
MSEGRAPAHALRSLAGAGAGIDERLDEATQRRARPLA